MKKVGLITVGQSPRTDVTRELKDCFDRNVELIEVGALDGITEEELSAIAPRKNETALVSRLCDGRQVIFAEERILPRLQKCIDQLQAQGAEVVLFLCTGKFPPFISKVPLLFPYEILRTLLPVVGGKQALTVIVPDELQIDESVNDWSQFADHVQVIAASPYGCVDDLLQRVMQTPIEGEVIVLDCIGYTREAKQKIAAISGKRVLLARTVAARIAAEII